MNSSSNSGHSYKAVDAARLLKSNNDNNGVNSFSFGEIKAVISGGDNELFLTKLARRTKDLRFASFAGSLVKQPRGDDISKLFECESCPLPSNTNAVCGVSVGDDDASECSDDAKPPRHFGLFFSQQSTGKIGKAQDDVNTTCQLGHALETTRDFFDAAHMDTLFVDELSHGLTPVPPGSLVYTSAAKVDKTDAWYEMTERCIESAKAKAVVTATLDMALLAYAYEALLCVHRGE